MSLGIDMHKVVGVTIGGKETLIIRGSFYLDCYRFRRNGCDDYYVGSGLGYYFQATDGGKYCGPIEAIQMVEVSG